nr:hypothetical protein [Chryseobacterium sp. D764]
MFPIESKEYQDFLNDTSATKTKAMRSKRK